MSRDPTLGINRCKTTKRVRMKTMKTTKKVPPRAKLPELSCQGTDQYVGYVRVCLQAGDVHVGTSIGWP